MAIDNNVIADEISTDSNNDGNGFMELNDTVATASQELKLEKDYAYNPANDTKFENGIVIDKDNFVVDGDGHTIDGAGQARIFTIKSSNVALKNINFINGFSTASGGAIYALQNVTNLLIENCRFDNNSAITCGAVGLFGNDTTIRNCIFTNNFANQTAAAVGAENGLTIENSRFANNNASEDFTCYGGAVYVDENATIENCNFTGNYAGLKGGAVYFNRFGTVKYCRFNDNTAGFDGGSICFVTNGTVNNCDFTNSYAEWNGGAIFSNNTGYIADCTFADNVAGYNAGAVYSRNNITIDHCNFTNNCAKCDGGAVYCENNASICGCDFNKNTANETGGAVYCENAPYVEDCRFNDNVANGDYAGAMYIEDKGIIINSAFTNNTAYMGSAVWAIANLYVENSTFSDNHAEGYGGAIFSNYNAIYNNCNFTNNSGSAAGAIFGFNNQTINNCSFTSNMATDENGGAVYFETTSTVENSTFTGNSAGYYGGALFANSAVVKNCDFTDNSALWNGGAAYFDDESSIEDSTFNGNYVDWSGGAAYFSNKGSVSGCEFNNNDAYFEGGAIFSRDNATIRKSKFDNNSAANGGAIIFYNPASLVGCEFVYNTADIGGAIVTSADLNITDSIFKDNAAEDGTNNIAVYGDAKVTLNNVTPPDLIPLKVANMELINIAGDTYGDIINITVNVSSNGEAMKNGTVYIVIDNVNHTANVENGIATISIPNLDVGLYTGVVTYTGDESFGHPNIDVMFIVYPKIAIIELVSVTGDTYGDIIRITVNVTCDGKLMKNGTVYLIINNATYTDEVENGIATISIQNLDAGTYLVPVVYDGGSYMSQYVNVTFMVNPKLVAVESIKVSDVKYGEPLTITVTISESLSGGAIFFNIGGIFYSTPVTYGIGSITIPNLNAGSYAGLLIYLDENHISPASEFNFKVAKLDAAITAANKAYVINYGGKYSITLKDANGNALSNKKVTFILNGKTIGTATTNSKGVATMSLTAKQLKAAKAGKRNLVIGFAGDANYNAVLKTIKITVKKEKTKIAAKKKTFKKSQKVKKYTITLKNSKKKAVKKVCVTLKINGKTYKAKTNKKGKAIFKIKKLTKKGTFKATVKFNGNKYYLKATKNVKIKIK